jgi:hypothetical protein
MRGQAFSIRPALPPKGTPKSSGRSNDKYSAIHTGLCAFALFEFQRYSVMSLGSQAEASQHLIHLVNGTLTTHMQCQSCEYSTRYFVASRLPRTSLATISNLMSRSIPSKRGNPLPRAIGMVLKTISDTSFRCKKARIVAPPSIQTSLKPCSCAILTASSIL